MDTQTFWISVKDKFDNDDQRWGQAMFNTLVLEAKIDMNPVWGNLDDPFYRIKTRHSAISWFAKFVEVDDDGIILRIKERA
jgi:hypothetical protein